MGRRPNPPYKIAPLLTPAKVATARIMTAMTSFNAELQDTLDEAMRVYQRDQINKRRALEAELKRRSEVKPWFPWQQWVF